MKKLLTIATLTALLAGCVAFPGCMLPNYQRLVPENKDAHIKIYNPVYGYIEIDTRVKGSTNELPPLPLPTK